MKLDKQIPSFTIFFSIIKQTNENKFTFFALSKIF